MRIVCCTVEYDGTEFHGFQRQPDRLTIQGAIEEALARLTGEKTVIHGAGRTDAGVHARGQVFHFATASTIPTERWPAALNSRLPRTIIVRKAEEAPSGFHARKSATGKLYSYTIYNAPLPSVFHDRFALHVARPLDVAKMREAARFVVGRRDFAAFRAAGSTPVRSTMRHLRRLEVERSGECIVVWAEADGFLYHMVRNLVGSLLAVGQGKHPPDWMKYVLESRDRGQAGATAPARGLCLERVTYG